MRNYNHRRSSDKIWAQEGRLFRQKVVIFPSFSSAIMKFFLTNRTSFVYWSSSPKTSKSLMLEVAKVLKLTLFSVRSLKSLTPAFSQIFPVTPIFFQDFDNRYWGKHSTNIWGSSWCKRPKARSSLIICHISKVKRPASGEGPLFRHCLKSETILASVSFWPLLIIELVARVPQHVLFTHDLLVKQV